MVKTTEQPVSNELILKMGYVAKDILSRVTLTPEASYRLINIPRKLLTAEFFACHMVGVIQDELGIPMSEIIKTAETGEKTPLLIRKIRIAEIQRRLEEIRITRLKCKNRLNAITMEEKRITDEMEKLKNEQS